MDLITTTLNIEKYVLGLQQMPKSLEVVLSPALLSEVDIVGKNVVVIDILRATSTICTALHHGALGVKPVTHAEEAALLKDIGYITAAERNGEKLPGFDMGNSPFECMDGKVKDKYIALTTTNGTKCIEMTDGAANVLSGSFLNISSLANWLIDSPNDIILFCAGWKDKVNMEDTLFAGALALKLKSFVEIDCDSAQMAMQIYSNNSDRIIDFLKDSSHYKRLSRLHHEEDMIYCFQEDIMDCVPVLKNGILVAY